jgi:hypothetical protein
MRGLEHGARGKGDAMRLRNDSKSIRLVEQMLLREMDRDGHIMVRSLDKVHAHTGLAYVQVSAIARRLEERDTPTAGAV